MNITKLAALLRIFGRESARDPRFVDWCIKKSSPPLTEEDYRRAESDMPEKLQR